MWPWYTILIVVFWLALLVMSIVMATTKHPRSHRVVDVEQPNIQQVYDDSKLQNMITVDSVGKPFRVTSTAFAPPSFDASNFADAVSGVVPFGTGRLCGFVFRPLSPVVITALQCVAQFQKSGTSSVGVFDGETKQELTSAQDRTVGLGDELNANGFTTHRLQTPITLLANKQYAIVALVAGSDLFGTSSMLVMNPVIQLMFAAATPNAVTMGFPTSYSAVDTIQSFVSFQCLIPRAKATVFDVDLANGAIPRFPPGFVSGFTLVVNTVNNNASIDTGFASAALTGNNIRSSTSLTFTAQQGINGIDVAPMMPNTFYNVFVIASSDSANPVDVATILSLSNVAPRWLPPGYDLFRRIATVKASDTTSQFESIRQVGDGPNRTTFFTRDIDSTDRMFVGITAISEGKMYAAPLLQIGVLVANPLVPTTASKCSILVHGIVGPSGLTPTNGFIGLYDANATSVLLGQISIPNSGNFFTQIEIPLGKIPLPHAFSYSVVSLGTSGNGIPADFALLMFVTGYFETV